MEISIVRKEVVKESEYKNEYGRIIAYERKRTKLSVTQICEGICERSYMQRIESGERFCDKMLADALLQRLGVSSEKFSYVISKQELNMIVWKEKIVDLVDQNQKNDAYYEMDAYRKQTEAKGVLYTQFLLLSEIMLKWKNGEKTDRLLEKVLEAWNLTRRNKKIYPIKPQRLSYFELALALLHARLSEDSTDEFAMTERYQDLLEYLEKRVEEADRVKWYPQIAYRFIRLLQKQKKQKEALQYSEKAIQLLQKQGSIIYLPELLEQYRALWIEKAGGKIEYLPPSIQRQLSEAEGICQALNLCYREYKIEPLEWIWYISFGMSELYLCQDIIKGRREGLGWTQIELAEGICDPVTVSRIESGASFPKRGTLGKLLQKVKWSGENCTLIAQSGKAENHRITSQVSNLTYLGKHKDAEILLEQLEKENQTKNVFVEQYFLSNLATVQFALGKKNGQEFYTLLEEALHLTVPVLDKEKLQKWHFMRAEVMAVNEMSYSCENVGKMEYVIDLLEAVKKFYERQHFDLRHYRAGYELTLRNLGNLLGNLGEYQEAVQLADMCIKLSLQSQKIGNTATALYDKGWGMEHLLGEGKFGNKESLSYIKASYYFDLFLGRNKQCEFTKKHIEEYYSDDI